MRKVVRGARKLIVAAIGIPVIIVGIILIPLPGPGILVCLLGFFILSLEFEWAARKFEYFKSQAQKIVADAKEKYLDDTK